jgi:alkylated DNA repair protein (DNA oxidative demethylase)
MIPDLFEGERPDVPLAPGAILLGGFAQPFEGPLVVALWEVVERAPFRHMVTPGGPSDVRCDDELRDSRLGH